MKSIKKQQGFHVIEVLLIVLVIGILGFLGYTYYNNFIKTNNTVNSGKIVEQSPVATDVVSAPTINSAGDLVKAEKVLDETNLDSNSDSTQLDTQLENF